MKQILVSFVFLLVATDILSTWIFPVTFWKTFHFYNNELKFTTSIRISRMRHRLSRGAAVFKIQSGLSREICLDR